MSRDGALGPGMPLGAGQHLGSSIPPHLARPEVRAALEATRAKFAMQQQQNGGAGAVPPLPTSANQPQQQQQQQAGIPAGWAAGPAPGVGRVVPAAGASQHAGAYRTNPMFGEAALLSPDKKVDREYTPRLADAIRAPSLDALVPDAHLPPVGDLFAAQPALPAYVDTARLAAPTLPAWDTQRPFLTGRFLYAEAAAAGAPGGRGAAQRDDQPPVLESYPPHVQESLLVDDLLSAFMGLNGSYVRVRLAAAPGGDRLSYEVAPRGQLEPAMQEMAARMLPICEYVAVVQRFVETRRGYAWGLVCQALAGAMRRVLQDWDLMAAQLEHQLRAGRLTLQALWYYVQPPMEALKLVASLAAEASAGRLRGAPLLDLLHARCAAAMGDAAAHHLALRLLRAAAEPYFAMLERWLCEGEVDDPYGEFMVQEDASIQRDSLNADSQSAFWHDRFTLRPALHPFTGAPLTEAPAAAPPTAAQQLAGGAGPAAVPPAPPLPRHDVPAFLQRQKRAVLDTGKYLNVMRQCGAEPPRTLPPGTRLEYDEAGRFEMVVDEAHRAASSAAMELLRRQQDLAGGLSVLKRYFLTAQGDMLLHFMDAAGPELRTQSAGVSLLQLQSLLEGAVRGSSAAADPEAARLAAAWDHRSILTMLIASQQALTAAAGAEGAARTPFSKLKPATPAPMTASERSTVGKKRIVRESFMLSYEVPWPLSIAAPEAALAQYQMVFRHIFELKWVERELTRVVQLLQRTGGLANRRARLRRAARASPPPPGGDPLDAALAQSYGACQLMTHFFRQYLLYVTFEVMEPLWAAFQARVQAASSLDEIVEQHQAFLRRLMKGCLLSRKVVVLRALLNLKELALRFVKAAGEAARVRWGALEEQVEQRFLGTGRKAEGRREQRLLKASLARAQLEAQLSRAGMAESIRELRVKFLAKAGDFIKALGEAHRTAHSERSDTREELESLLNLMSRLDFNGYFSAAAPAGDGDPGLAAAAGERMMVRFAAE